MSSRRYRSNRRDKRNGYIVKGITPRHWWDRYDKDRTGNSRQVLKRAITTDMRKAYGLEL